MIIKNYERDSLFDNYALSILRERYMLEDESSPQDALARAAEAFASNEAHAQRLYDYASQHWFMFASPLLSNAGTDRGLPISCYLNMIGDSRESIFEHWAENGWLASNGGGIGSYLGAVRSDGTKTSRGVKSTGSIPFLKVVDSEMLAVSQGTVRRGAYASYQDISHPEIVEFINMRKVGGDPDRKCHNLHHAVNITDKFMRVIEECINNPEANDDWELIDPHSGTVTEIVSAKYLWQLIVQTRMETGEPYIHFIDHTNAVAADHHKHINLFIKNSNLCVEILLPVTDDRTAVCCISSLNLEYYDEWKNTSIVEDLVEMLDNTLSIFIEKAPDCMKKAVNSASKERSIGLGTMGFHSYLQRNMIPFESEEARKINLNMFEGIYARAYSRSVSLAEERGPAPDFISAQEQGWVGEVRRNSYLMAIAPNATSSIICGNTSPGIEPMAANAYEQVTHNGTNINRNKWLDYILCDCYDEYDTKAIWKSISDNKGSVQHLDFLSEEHKEVFKTAEEINQSWIVKHAADRYAFIDQGQSVNLFFNAEANIKDVHNVHFEAWKQGIKTLYYCRTYVTNRAENINHRFDRQLIGGRNQDIQCVGCSD